MINKTYILKYLQWHRTKCDLFREEFLLKIPRIIRDMNYLPQAKWQVATLYNR